MIEVNSVSKVFEDNSQRTKALKEVSFSCNSGEIFGLLGPNGAGKTTCLRILSTVLCPTTGNAKVANYDVVNDPQEVRRRIGFISGNTGIYDRLTPHETILYFGKLYGLSTKYLKNRCEEIYEMFQMKDFIHTLNGKLSTGMKQKVSIARTIVHDPPVLIFDEPTANLDILVAKNVLNFILDCREKGKCIILSTHIMSEAQKLCDRIGIIHQGELLVQGKMEDLYEKHNCRDIEDIFFSLIDIDK
ncbi:ATP-binding cassette domain-containing protein [Candidatus Uabimicrobium sp. HlEnr_7]|uniref:ATP-binding cassette domain-containing protein n=1 Tax=Candidatus Uabimicrobium helgolandensis TaxID=3095367 RepID=UPI003558D607